MGRPVRVEGSEGGATCDSHNGVYRPVFVSNIKAVEKVEYLPLPTGESLIIEEKLSNPIARRFQLLASEFVARLGSPARELKIAILYASIVPDHIPSDMVEGGTKVVDSIAYYCGEYGRDGLDESNLNVWLATLQVMGHTKSVRLARYEGFELPFKVRSMMIGAFNF
jgi:hypothetical protein